MDCIIREDAVVAGAIYVIVVCVTSVACVFLRDWAEDDATYLPADDEDVVSGW
jgi:hypothetical protein